MDAHAVRICVSITARICRPEASFVPVDLDINPTRRTRTTAMVCGVVWILYSLENLNIYFFIGRQAYSGAPEAKQDNRNSVIYDTSFYKNNSSFHASLHHFCHCTCAVLSSFRIQSDQEFRSSVGTIKVFTWSIFSQIEPSVQLPTDYLVACKRS